ncbi:non-ribosomal peptide synthetase, partial [Chitinivorax sp. B]|uniref:non-ribosomal peptide synthetase n=1 Tax=Chitinivorax sp. B TaxID=2502235 RepID=UPI0010F78C05
PPARVADILSEAAVAWLVVDAAHHASLAGTGSQLIGIEAILADPSLPDNPPAVTLQPTQLAYATFTSGTTGKPKGVLIAHHSLMAIADAWQAVYQLQPGQDRWLQMANANFDVYAGDLLRTLATGNTLVICPRPVLLDPAQLHDYLQQQRITAAEFVPAVLRELAGWVQEQGQHLDRLRLVIVGSDSWYATDHALLRQVCGEQVRLINTYGVTEATIDSTYYEAPAGESWSGMVPIGRPFAQSRIYLLDSALQPVPLGVAGELCIGGPGVARGYLNRPDLTADKFIDDPFSTRAGAKLYRTGDIARFRADGVVELVGRADHQVKIRGFRIELGEIETQLRRSDGIRDALVVAHALSVTDLRLVAYVVCEGEPRPAHWREVLREHLPDYMIPTAFVQLAALPVTGNGKLDRKALPAPDFGGEGQFVAPVTAMEQLLASIWQEMLGLAQPVSAQDNFFAIGGHSLLAMKLVAQLRRRADLELPVATVFEAQTLSQLASVLERTPTTSTAVVPMQSRPADQAAPLSFAQQRLWVLDQMEGGSLHYHMTTLLKIDGELDITALEAALRHVLDRHQVLRSTYHQDGDRIWQQPLAKLPLPLLQIREVSEQASEWQAVVESLVAQPFDLAHDLPFRACMLRLTSRQYLLALVVHHIAADGWSEAILVEECCAAYAALTAGHEPSLPPLPIQYGDYAAWQRQPEQLAHIDAQLAYWSRQLADLPDAHNLPLDFPRPSQQRFVGRIHRSRIDADTTAALRAACQRDGATLFMGLHAVFAALLSRYSGETDIVIGTPIANREQLDVANLIGFFVNTLVLRADLSGQESFASLLAQSRTTLLDAYAHQQLPFDRLVEVLKPQRSLAYSPLFQVMLSLQNNSSKAIELNTLQIDFVDPEQTTSQFDLTLNVSEEAASLDLSWEYSSDLFRHETIVQLSDHFAILLQAALAQPDRLLTSLPLQSDAARAHEVTEWNQTQRAYPQGQCVHELIEAQAAATPAAVAVRYRGQSLTYGEL